MTVYRGPYPLSVSVSGPSPRPPVRSLLLWPVGRSWCCDAGRGGAAAPGCEPVPGLLVPPSHSRTGLWVFSHTGGAVPLQEPEALGQRARSPAPSAAGGGQGRQGDLQDPAGLSGLDLASPVPGGSPHRPGTGAQPLGVGWVVSSPSFLWSRSADLPGPGWLAPPKAHLARGVSVFPTQTPLSTLN